MSYTWTHFDGEDGEPSYYAVLDPDGEEFCTIVHRDREECLSISDEAYDRITCDKEGRAQLLVDLLNAADTDNYAAERGAA